jgi:hypothetical protein
MAAIAARAPGFAGMFWDSAGGLVVRTTAAADPFAVHQAVATPIVSRRFRGVLDAVAEGRVQLRADAAWDFQSLLAWRETLGPTMAQNGATYSSVDEVRNGIRIGLVTPEAESPIRDAARSMSIPSGALLFEPGQPLEQLTDLRDRFRPAPGGVQIERLGGPDGGCTVGANVVTDVGAGFLTASHCTYWFWQLDGIAFYQNNNGSQSDFVGWEGSDPDPFTGYAFCRGFAFCRYSDAAFIGYEGDFGEQGYLARTTGLGSITIDFWHPRFTVSEEGGWPLAGTEITKMGRTTGWTSGEVTETCVDIAIAEYPGGLYLCQFETDAFADRGDSGGPFFTWPLYDDDVALQGLVTGRRTIGQYFVSSYFSSWIYVALEIGADVGVLTAVR